MPTSARAQPAPHRRLRLGMLAAGGLLVLGLVLLVLLTAGHGAQAAPRPPGRPVTMAWGGDTTLGSSFGLPPQDGFAVLQDVAPVLGAADLSAVNSEGTFATGGSSKCGSGSSNCFAFRAPPRNTTALKRAGVDIVNLANNHAFDFGATGLGQTITALRRHDVAVTGRPGEITVLTVPGAKVAFVGFAAYPWTSSINDLPGVRALVRRAAGSANLVVVFMHAGAEGADRTHVPAGGEEAFGEQRGDSRAFAHTAVDAGADLVLGSGPHVVRGIELYKGRLVAYSLGNLGGYRNFATGGTLSLSGILRTTMDDDGRFLAGRLTSLTLDGTGIPHLDAGGRAGALIAELSKVDFGARGVGVRRDGTIVAPG
ncbi:MAG: CapA family protein [Solirubrobacterales bacterium]|nr:CapA family protein [Solirubrobacterales bacterium]